MGIPTEGEVFSQLLEHVRKAQEASAMLAHLCDDRDKLRRQGWLAISEMFKLTVKNITALAMRKMH
jgi:hypothetical protein